MEEKNASIANESVNITKQVTNVLDQRKEQAKSYSLLEVRTNGIFGVSVGKTLSEDEKIDKNHNIHPFIAQEVESHVSKGQNAVEHSVNAPSSPPIVKLLMTKSTPGIEKSLLKGNSREGLDEDNLLPISNDSSSEENNICLNRINEACAQNSCRTNEGEFLERPTRKYAELENSKKEVDKRSALGNKENLQSNASEFNSQENEISSDETAPSVEKSEILDDVKFLAQKEGGCAMETCILDSGSSEKELCTNADQFSPELQHNKEEAIGVKNAFHLDDRSHENEIPINEMKLTSDEKRDDTSSRNQMGEDFGIPRKPEETEKRVSEKSIENSGGQDEGLCSNTHQSELQNSNEREFVDSLGIKKSLESNAYETSLTEDETSVDESLPTSDEKNYVVGKMDQKIEDIETDHPSSELESCKIRTSVSTSGVKGGSLSEINSLKDELLANENMPTSHEKNEDEMVDDITGTDVTMEDARILSPGEDETNDDAARLEISSHSRPFEESSKFVMRSNCSAHQQETASSIEEAHTETLLYNLESKDACSVLADEVENNLHDDVQEFTACSSKGNMSLARTNTTHTKADEKSLVNRESTVQPGLKDISETEIGSFQNTVNTLQSSLKECSQTEIDSFQNSENKLQSGLKNGSGIEIDSLPITENISQSGFKEGSQTVIDSLSDSERKMLTLVSGCEKQDLKSGVQTETSDLKDVTLERRGDAVAAGKLEEDSKKVADVAEKKVNVPSADSILKTAEITCNFQNEKIIGSIEGAVKEDSEETSSSQEIISTAETNEVTEDLPEMCDEMPQDVGAKVDGASLEEISQSSVGIVELAEAKKVQEVLSEQKDEMEVYKPLHRQEDAKEAVNDMDSKSKEESVERQKSMMSVNVSLDNLKNEDESLGRQFHLKKIKEEPEEEIEMPMELLSEIEGGDDKGLILADVRKGKPEVSSGNIFDTIRSETEIVREHEAMQIASSLFLDAVDSESDDDDDDWMKERIKHDLDNRKDDDLGDDYMNTYDDKNPRDELMDRSDDETDKDKMIGRYNDESEGNELMERHDENERDELVDRNVDDTDDDEVVCYTKDGPEDYEEADKGGVSELPQRDMRLKAEKDDSGKTSASEKSSNTPEITPAQRLIAKFRLQIQKSAESTDILQSNRKKRKVQMPAERLQGKQDEKAGELAANDTKGAVASKRKAKDIGNTVEKKKAKVDNRKKKADEGIAIAKLFPDGKTGNKSPVSKHFKTSARKSIQRSPNVENKAFDPKVAVMNANTINARANEKRLMESAMPTANLKKPENKVTGAERPATKNPIRNLPLKSKDLGISIGTVAMADATSGNTAKNKERGSKKTAKQTVTVKVSVKIMCQEGPAYVKFTPKGPINVVEKGVQIITVKQKANAHGEKGAVKNTASQSNSVNQTTNDSNSLLTARERNIQRLKELIKQQEKAIEKIREKKGDGRVSSEPIVVEEEEQVMKGGNNTTDITNGNQAVIIQHSDEPPSSNCIVQAHEFKHSKHKKGSTQIKIRGGKVTYLNKSSTSTSTCKSSAKSSASPLIFTATTLPASWSFIGQSTLRASSSLSTKTLPSATHLGTSVAEIPTSRLSPPTDGSPLTHRSLHSSDISKAPLSVTPSSSLAASATSHLGTASTEVYNAHPSLVPSVPASLPIMSTSAASSSLVSANSSLPCLPEAAHNSMRLPSDPAHSNEKALETANSILAAATRVQCPARDFHPMDSDSLPRITGVRSLANVQEETSNGSGDQEETGLNAPKNVAISAIAGLSADQRLEILKTLLKAKALMNNQEEPSTKASTKEQEAPGAAELINSHISNPTTDSSQINRMLAGINNTLSQAVGTLTNNNQSLVTKTRPPTSDVSGKSTFRQVTNAGISSSMIPEVVRDQILTRVTTLSTSTVTKSLPETMASTVKATSAVPTNTIAGSLPASADTVPKSFPISTNGPAMRLPVAVNCMPTSLPMSANTMTAFPSLPTSIVTTKPLPIGTNTVPMVLPVSTCPMTKPLLESKDRPRSVSVITNISQNRQPINIQQPSAMNVSSLKSCSTTVKQKVILVQDNGNFALMPIPENAAMPGAFHVQLNKNDPSRISSANLKEIAAKTSSYLQPQLTNPYFGGPSSPAVAAVRFRPNILHQLPGFHPNPYYPFCVPSPTNRQVLEQILIPASSGNMRLPLIVPQGQIQTFETPRLGTSQFDKGCTTYFQGMPQLAPIASTSATQPFTTASPTVRTGIAYTSSVADQRIPKPGPSIRKSLSAITSMVDPKPPITHVVGSNSQAKQLEVSSIKQKLLKIQKKSIAKPLEKAGPTNKKRPVNKTLLIESSEPDRHDTSPCWLVKAAKVKLFDEDRCKLWFDGRNDLKRKRSLTDSDSEMNIVKQVRQNYPEKSTDRGFKVRFGSFENQFVLRSDCRGPWGVLPNPDNDDFLHLIGLEDVVGWTEHMKNSGEDFEKQYLLAGEERQDSLEDNSSSLYRDLYRETVRKRKMVRAIRRRLKELKKRRKHGLDNRIAARVKLPRKEGPSITNEIADSESEPEMDGDISDSSDNANNIGLFSTGAGKSPVKLKEVFVAVEDVLLK